MFNMEVIKETKKRKLNNDNNEVAENTSQSAAIFKDFQLIKVLREDARHKLITLHGLLPHSEDDNSDVNDVKEAEAVIILEKKPFDKSALEKQLRLTKTLETLHNDIYSTHDVYNTADTIADMKATVICPATEKHIVKYSEHEPFIIHETPILYQTITLPCIKESNFSVQWVYNILEKKTESDRIIAEDPDPENGFIMIPDMKWDRENVENLYTVAIVQKHGIKSLRDLREEHLPLLANILKTGQSAIKDKYNISADKLRVYFHYQPSYYHLHIHFTHVKFEAPGTDALRAHLIEEVMDNLRLDSEYYMKRTLSFVIREKDLLYQRYKDSDYFS